MARRDAEDARARGARRDARKSRGVSVRVRARHRRFRRRAVGPGGGGHAARRDARAVGASTGTTHRSSAMRPATKVPARVEAKTTRRGDDETVKAEGNDETVKAETNRRDDDRRSKVDVVEAEIGETFDGRRRNVDGRRRVFRRVVRVRRRREHGDAEARGKDGEDAAVQDGEDAAVQDGEDAAVQDAKTPPSGEDAAVQDGRRRPRQDAAAVQDAAVLDTKNVEPNPNPANSSRRRTRAEKLDPPRWNSSTRTGVARPNHARFRRGGVVSKTTEDSERDANSAPAAMTPAMTPTRALLERAFREKGMTTLDREDAPTTIRARGAVFPGETTAEDATGNVGGGGTDGKSSRTGDWPPRTLRGRPRLPARRRCTSRRTRV